MRWSRSARGCCSQCRPDEVEAVLGHEISHIANGDMITMGLIQGASSTPSSFFFREYIGFVIDRVVFRTEQGVGPGYYIFSIIAQIFLSFLATMIVMWFSTAPGIQGG